MFIYLVQKIKIECEDLEDGESEDGGDNDDQNESAKGDTSEDFYAKVNSRLRQADNIANYGQKKNIFNSLARGDLLMAL